VQFVASQNETVIDDVCGDRALNFSCTLILRVLHERTGRFFAFWSSKFQFVLFFMVRQPLVGHGLLIIEASRSHTTHHTQ